MKKDKNVMEVWEAVRDELRKLRGQNRFRGNEEHLLHRQEIRLHRESRGDQMAHGLVVLHLTPHIEDLWADGLSVGLPAKAADFGGDWKVWLGKVVDDCRGGAYLHTQSGSAAYRKPQADATTNNEGI